MDTWFSEALKLYEEMCVAKKAAKHADARYTHAMQQIDFHQRGTYERFIEKTNAIYDSVYGPKPR